MSNIPKAREQLGAVADGLRTGNLDAEAAAGEIDEILPLLFRRSCVRRASAESQKMTPLLAKKIRDHAYRNPEETYMAMASRFNVSIGRISEVLADD